MTDDTQDSKNFNISEKDFRKRYLETDTKDSEKQNTSAKNINQATSNSITKNEKNKILRDINIWKSKKITVSIN